jgi:hypothetical protein
MMSLIMQKVISKVQNVLGIVPKNGVTTVILKIYNYSLIIGIRGIPYY